MEICDQPLSRRRRRRRFQVFPQLRRKIRRSLDEKKSRDWCRKERVSLQKVERSAGQESGPVVARRSANWDLDEQKVLLAA